MSSTFIYALIMFIAGLGIPIMAAFNGGLGSKLQSPALASAILFSFALLIAVIYLVVTEGIPQKLYAPNAPWYFYCGGFFVMFYITTITWIAPKFGLSNAIAFVLLGQLVAMSVIDHFGLVGAPQYTLSLQRLMGLVFMAVGVFMVLNKAR